MTITMCCVLLLVLLLALAPASALAQEAVSAGELRVDRPTLVTLGVQLLISGDDDGDAEATVRYRPEGGDWHQGPSLLRVWPETVTGRRVEAQFAGSLFDLAPATVYEVEVRLVDADGGVDETLTATAATRAVPRAEPVNARRVDVTTPAELRQALQGAQPGDVIILADGTYATDRAFVLQASGTAEDPIIIRGQSQDGVVVDGGDCGCNVFELYGSFVHLEDLTIQNAARAIRFLGQGAEANVVRQVVIADVVHGIGSQADQRDFYLCDNVVRGRLAWPLVSPDDGAQHNDDQGIRVDGDGHVICHNAISGFGDPMLNFAEGHRANDWYGNEIFDIYGDATELDRAEGNIRLFRNRFTNVYTAISMQPIYGGPAYVLRNEVVNVADEQVKLKSVGSDIEPSGALIFHNSFVSPAKALNLQTPITQHNFRVENNLFVGPDSPERGFTVDWTATVDRGVFDYNGYYPDRKFWFGKTAGGDNRLGDSFAAVRAAWPVEEHGILVAASPFASGVAAPADYRTAQPPQALDLADGSTAVDAARPLAGINDGFVGAAPDIGAVELGCARPLYGPRPAGADEAHPVDCATTTSGGQGGDAGGDAGRDAGADASGDTGTDPTDTGATDDAGASDDTGRGAGDGGTADDGGPGSPADEGCGCRSTGDKPPAGALVVFAAATAWAIRPRRGRR